MKLFIKPVLLAACALVFMAVPQPQPAFAADAPIIIRDTEIENIFKEWMTPLLEAAGIDKNGVHLIIVQSPQINAFVAGGANIFIYTGNVSVCDKSFFNFCFPQRRFPSGEVRSNIKLFEYGIGESFIFQRFHGIQIGGLPALDANR